MAWTLAHNLVSRTNSVHAVYPSLTVYNIGDQTHQAECSDHNPDARGVVHAIDVMCAAGTAEAKAILPWALGWHNDLQYVIHNGRIWGVNNGGFSGPGQVYTGSDPHTNHIHISGKHGSTGRNAATCTGYDTAAEAMTPPPLEEEDVPLSTTDTQAIATKISVDVNNDGSGISIGLRKQMSAVVSPLIQQVIELLGNSAKVEQAISSAVAALPTGVQVDQNTLKVALLDALKELASADDAPAAQG